MLLAEPGEGAYFQLYNMFQYRPEHTNFVSQY
jgi:hypothetical protein